MSNETEKNNLMLEFGIQEQIATAFKNILELNTTQDLDIENKDLSIDSQNIEYSKPSVGCHRFQTQILDNKNRNIGYYALVVSDTNEIIDEFFVTK